MDPKREQKVDPKLDPFGEPRCSETQGIQRVLELFDRSEGSSFGLILGVILGSFSGHPNFGTFQRI